MLKHSFFIFLHIFFLSCAMHAQVVFDVKIDSTQMLIGEQTNITFNVTVDSNQKLQMPNYNIGHQIVPNVEIVDIQSADTNYLNEGKRLEILQCYVITAWDSSFYYLPPFEIEVDGEKYQSKSLALKVFTIDVDTTQLDMFFPPFGIMEPPFSWDDWRLIVELSFLVAILCIMATFLFDRARKGKPIVRFIRRIKIIPPHKIAINEIEKIKAERKWAEEDSKEYYTLLTSTLRTYIQNRYGFNALDMTSNEIIERLMQEENPSSLDELREIFTTADLVKFAKYSTLINENDANLVAAVEYINQTKIEIEPTTKPEPEVIKETDKKRMNQVILIRVVASIMVLFAVGIICWGVWRITDLLM